jgi:alpha-beta hydrolase superfamily lysophospholipase
VPQADPFLTQDGLRLFTRRWESGTPPKAVLVLAHGYAEHSERYAHFGEHLAARGYTVCALDHRGHGRSEGERANIPDFGVYVRDLERFAASVRARYPGVPQVLMGHSLGGAIALQVALEHPHSWAGLIVSAPFLVNAVAVPAYLERVSGPVARWLPALPTLKLDSRKLARDPDVVSAYDRDPLVYTGRVKARMGYEMAQAGPRLLAAAPDLRLPVLILHGDADGVADPEGSRRLFAAVGSPDKTLKLYPGGYHEPLNDLDKAAVMADILAWLEARVALWGEGALLDSDS